MHPRKGWPSAPRRRPWLLGLVRAATRRPLEWWFQAPQATRRQEASLRATRGKDNISCDNEPFTKKLRSYANTLYWSETLREDCYKSKLDFAEFIKTQGLGFRAMAAFGPEEVEERQRLLFSLCQMIWPADVGTGA